MTRLETYLNQLQRFGIRPGLERVHAVLERLGRPHLNYPVVLVGGTNGKGSTCEFLANLLAARGHTVGLYTSPHLYHWNERIRVLETSDYSSPVNPPQSTTQDPPRTTLFPSVITDAALDTLFDETLPHLEAIAATLGQPTEFETLTALGLWHFARVRVEVAVIEVGLGGKWDATNVTAPVVSVITHVALDHCDRLGSTLEAIARDKVEIARPGHILVTAETGPPVLQVFQEHCAAHDVKLWPIRSPGWSNDAARLESHLERLAANGHALAQDQAQPSFQQLNMFTAAAVKLALETSLGWPQEDFAPATGWAVPGRTEVLREAPTVIIDGANNPDGADHLAAYLVRALKSAVQETVSAPRLILVLGILADKDYGSMIGRLAPLAHAVVVTQSVSPRATPVQVLMEATRSHCQHVETVTPVQAAVERALSLARPHDIICVTGSFYTIAEVDRAAVGAYRHPSAKVK